MKKIKVSVFIIVFAIFAAVIPSARTDDLAQAGRDLAAKYGDAVVTLQLVVKTTMSMQGEPDEKQESKSEVTGAVVDPSGLTVASLAAIDPTEVMSGMMSGSFDMKVASEITDLKIRLADGTEIPAKVVLRDKDLDLAFIRPLKKPDKPLTAIDMSKSSKPNLLDFAIMMARLGTVANRSLAISADRIQSIVEKPRLFYVPGMGAMSSELGAPAFAMDGNVIGILLLRSLPGGPSMSGNWLGMSSMGILPMILPAADVLSAAKQAAEANDTAP